MARYPLKYWKFFWVWNHVYVRHQQSNPHIPAVNTLPQACSQVLFREKEKIKRWLYLIQAELWEAFWDSLRYSSSLEMSEQTAVFYSGQIGRHLPMFQGTTWVTLQASLLMLLPLELSHSWPVPCITFLLIIFPEPWWFMLVLRGAGVRSCSPVSKVTQRLSHLPGTIPFNMRCSVGKPHGSRLLIKKRTTCPWFYNIPEIGGMHCTLFF